MQYQIALPIVNIASSAGAVENTDLFSLKAKLPPPNECPGMT